MYKKRYTLVLSFKLGIRFRRGQYNISEIITFWRYSHVRMLVVIMSTDVLTPIFKTLIRIYLQIKQTRKKIWHY